MTAETTTTVNDKMYTFCQSACENHYTDNDTTDYFALCFLHIRGGSERRCDGLLVPKPCQAGVLGIVRDSSFARIHFFPTSGPGLSTQQGAHWGYHRHSVWL